MVGLAEYVEQAKKRRRRLLLCLLCRSELLPGAGEWATDSGIAAQRFGMRPKCGIILVNAMKKQQELVWRGCSREHVQGTKRRP